MSYNPQNYAKVREQLQKKRAAAQELAEQHTAQLYATLPELREIDRALQQTAPRMMGAILSKVNVEEKVAQIKRENLDLQAARRELLVRNGYPADYDAIHYECPTCQDTGAVGTKMCTCLKKALVLCGYESSGLGALLQTQSFDNFDLKYYQKSPDALRAAQAVLQKAKQFAASFSTKTTENLLFCGKTGLGKTHLCTSIAKELIERGFDVVYEVAQSLFSAMRQDHYQPNEATAARVRRYFECDLLILDDLGAEATSQASVSFLYDIVNTRLNSGKPMIINTNLTRAELTRLYSDRISSRLFGSFLPFLFLGEDIRSQRLSG